MSVESETAVFCVGVAHKPLITEKDGSLALWALEAHTGNDDTQQIYWLTRGSNHT